jgi:hypothetical protein
VDEYKESDSGRDRADAIVEEHLGIYIKYVMFGIIVV